MQIKADRSPVIVPVDEIERTWKPNSLHTNGHNLKTIIKPQIVTNAKSLFADSPIVRLSFSYFHDLTIEWTWWQLLKSVSTCNIG